jgi:hypothetical protein
MDELHQLAILVIDGAWWAQYTREITDHVQSPPPLFSQLQEGPAKPIAEVLDRATLVGVGNDERFREQPERVHASTTMDDEAWERGQCMQKVEEFLITLRQGTRLMLAIGQVEVRPQGMDTISGRCLTALAAVRLAGRGLQRHAKVEIGLG